MILIADAIESIFGLGLFINAILFIPQAMKLFHEKDSKELSLVTFLGFNLIQFFTVLHGILFKDYLLIIGNFLSLITCGVVTTLIIFYRFKNKIGK